jgi:hypothetical protein
MWSSRSRRMDNQSTISPISHRHSNIQLPLMESSNFTCMKRILLQKITYQLKISINKIKRKMKKPQSELNKLNKTV